MCLGEEIFCKTQKLKNNENKERMFQIPLRDNAFRLVGIGHISIGNRTSKGLDASSCKSYNSNICCC